MKEGAGAGKTWREGWVSVFVFLKVRYSHARPGVFMMGENVFELNWPDSHSGRSYGLMV